MFIYMMINNDTKHIRFNWLNKDNILILIKAVRGQYALRKYVRSH